MNAKSYMALMFVALVGCKKNAIIYNPEIMDDVPHIEATCDIIADDIECVYPIQIAELDSMIIVLDFAVNENFFHIYSNKGQLLAKFGKKGRGYGELISTPTHFSLDKHSVFVADKNKIIEYDIADLLAGNKQYTEQSMNNEVFKLNGNLPNNIYVKDGAYYCFCMSPDSRLKIISSDIDSCLTYNILPILNNSDEGIADNHIVWRYMPHTCISPNKRYIAQTTYIGAVLDILEITNDKIQHVSTQYIIEPVYEKFDHNNITIVDDTVIGFDAVCCTNEYIYGLINGNMGKSLRNRDFQYPYTRNISVFDWNGSLERVITTPYMMTSICVLSNNQGGYATTYKDGVYNLIKINWEFS